MKGKRHDHERRIDPLTLANQRAEIDILRRRIDASVLLVKALGGGWDVAELPKLEK
jgi:outer membrane protein TolC